MRKIYSIITILFVFPFSPARLSALNRKAAGAAEATGAFRADGGSEFKILAPGKGRPRIALTGIFADGEAVILG